MPEYEYGQPTYVRLPKPLHDRLNELAERDQRTLRQTIVRLLEQATMPQDNGKDKRTAKGAAAARQGA